MATTLTVRFDDGTTRITTHEDNAAAMAALAPDLNRPDLYSVDLNPYGDA